MVAFDVKSTCTAHCCDSVVSGFRSGASSLSVLFLDDLHDNLPQHDHDPPHEGNLTSRFFSSPGHSAVARGRPPKQEPLNTCCETRNRVGEDNSYNLEEIRPGRACAAAPAGLQSVLLCSSHHRSIMGQYSARRRWLCLSAFPGEKWTTSYAARLCCLPQLLFLHCAEIVNHNFILSIHE